MSCQQSARNCPQRDFFAPSSVVWVSIMCIISPNEHLYTTWGKNTLQVYILHTFIYFLNHRQVINVIGSTQQGKIFLLITSVLITILLSGKWISWWFKKISSAFIKTGDFLLNYAIMEDKYD